MNVNEALYVISKHISDQNQECRCHTCDVAKGFLECNERYKPLVSAIKDLIMLCHDQSGDWPEEGKKILEEIRSSVGGSK